MKALHEYYEALNRKDISDALERLDEDVLVRFPEEQRHWSGVAVAQDKFTVMLEKMPGFAGGWEAEVLLEFLLV